MFISKIEYIIFMLNLDINFLNETKNAIIFCYLCAVKEDYAYNIAKNFEKAIETKKWNKATLKVNSFLTNPSKLSVILKELEQNNFIKITKEKKVKGKIRKYYKIDVGVFVNDTILDKPPYLKELEKEINKQINRVSPPYLKEARNFLIEILNKYFFDLSSIKGLNAISELNKWKKFDFYMIIHFVFEFLFANLYLYSYPTIRGLKDFRESALNFIMWYFFNYVIRININSYKNYEGTFEESQLIKLYMLGLKDYFNA